MLMQALTFMVAQFGELGLEGLSSGLTDPDVAKFKNMFATIKYLADRVSS